MELNAMTVSFSGFWLCRLATDPDPSNDDRGRTGFTLAVGAEDDLDPSIFCQTADVERTYGRSPYAGLPTASESFHHGDIANIRNPSPDFTVFLRAGIGIKVDDVTIMGPASDCLAELTRRLVGGAMRFTSDGFPHWQRHGPIFEGRNQVVSDGDPDRFMVTPCIMQICDTQEQVVLQRFDPVDMQQPFTPLLDITDQRIVRECGHLPSQRFANSATQLQQLGVSDAAAHFQTRSAWLASKVAESEAIGNRDLAEAYRSRQYAVDFFTKSTGPTVFDNRLASRIPLRLLYQHQLRGTQAMAEEGPALVAQPLLGPGFAIDTNKPWLATYYLGGYDGDLFTGYCSGSIRIPYH